MVKEIIRYLHLRYWIIFDKSYPLEYIYIQTFGNNFNLFASYNTESNNNVQILKEHHA